MATCKTYTTEFKRQAIKLSNREVMTLSQFSRDLGISFSALHR